MTDEAVAISVFTDQHSTEGFDCGEPARNTWLRTRASANQRRDDTRTYVAVQTASVIGFYAITVSCVVRSTLPGALRRNAPDPISCVLLAQLAVALTHHGQGLGRELVLHAMRQAVKITEIAGCRLLAVHPATQRVVDFYARFGFVSVDATPALMVMSLSQVRAVLAAVDATTKSTPR